MKIFDILHRKPPKASPRVSEVLRYIKRGVEIIEQYSASDLQFIPRDSLELSTQNNLALELIKLLYNGVVNSISDIRVVVDKVGRSIGSTHVVDVDFLQRVTINERQIWIRLAPRGILLEFTDGRLKELVIELLKNSKSSRDDTVISLINGTNVRYILNLLKIGGSSPRGIFPFAHFSFYVMPDYGRLYTLEAPGPPYLEFVAYIHKESPWILYRRGPEILELPGIKANIAAGYELASPVQPVAFCWPWAQEEYYKKWGITE